MQKQCVFNSLCYVVLVHCEASPNNDVSSQTVMNIILKPIFFGMHSGYSGDVSYLLFFFAMLVFGFWG